MGDEIFHFDFSKTFELQQKRQTGEQNQVLPPQLFSFQLLKCYHFSYLCVPGLGRTIPPLARLYSRRWLGHLRLAVLLWEYQNHAQRCCFVQSPRSLLVGMRACSQCWSLRPYSFTARGLSVLQGVGAEPKLGSFHFLCLWQEK